MRTLPLTLLLTACAPPAPCPDVPPSVELTVEDDAGAPLVDGDGLMMVHGPQGGWHVAVGAAVADPDPQVDLHLTVDALDVRIVDNRYQVRLRQHDGCRGAYLGMYGYLALDAFSEGATPANTLAGETLAVRLEATTSSGTFVDEVHALAVPDPDDLEE